MNQSSGDLKLALLEYPRRDELKTPPPQNCRLQKNYTVDRKGA